MPRKAAPLPAIATLPDGLYTLRSDIENPGADRRTKGDWTRSETFPKGLYRVRRRVDPFILKTLMNTEGLTIEEATAKAGKVAREEVVFGTRSADFRRPLGSTKHAPRAKVLRDIDAWNTLVENLEPAKPESFQAIRMVHQIEENWEVDIIDALLSSGKINAEDILSAYQTATEEFDARQGVNNETEDLDEEDFDDFE